MHPPPAPSVGPWDEGLLDTGEGHRIRYEQCGNPAGVPVVQLHGGPGSGYSVRHRAFFDAARYRIVLFDQRGCGRSEPRGMLEANTLEHLVADIERLRRHLGIGQWLVSGGSWGACLALAYAARHRAACLGLLLRSLFLGEADDLRWFFHDARHLLPDAWAAFSAPAPAASRGDLRAWYGGAVGDPDRARALTAVRHWMQWEAALSRPARPAPPLPRIAAADAARLVDKYRVQSHYLLHDTFMGDGQALQWARELGDLPLGLIHGRLDLVCRPDNAWRVHHCAPGSRLQLVPNVGHDPFARPMLAAIVAATDHFAAHGDFAGWGAPVTGPKER